MRSLISSVRLFVILRILENIVWDVSETWKCSKSSEVITWIMIGLFQMISRGVLAPDSRLSLLNMEILTHKLYGSLSKALILFLVRLQLK